MTRVVRSSAVPDNGVAADLIGPLLPGADVVGLAAAAGFIATRTFLRARGEVPLGTRPFVAGAGVAVAASNDGWFAPRIEALRAGSAGRHGAFHQAGEADPPDVRCDGPTRPRRRSASPAVIRGFSGAPADFLARRADARGPRVTFEFEDGRCLSFEHDGAATTHRDA